jgi:hypothetical protein
MLVRSQAFTVAVTLFILGELLQLIFIICVDARLITLDHSVRFAGIGVPVWSLAIIVASMSQVTLLRKAAVIGGSLFGVGVWLFLIMLH